MKQSERERETEREREREEERKRETEREREREAERVGPQWLPHTNISLSCMLLCQVYFVLRMSGPDKPI